MFSRQMMSRQLMRLELSHRAHRIARSVLFEAENEKSLCNGLGEYDCWVESCCPLADDLAAQTLLELVTVVDSVSIYDPSSYTVHCHQLFVDE